VRALLFELGNRRVGALQRVLQLLAAALAVVAVEVEVLLDLVEAGADGLGAQDQLQARAIALRVDPRAVDAPRAGGARAATANPARTFAPLPFEAAEPCGPCGWGC